MYYYNPVPELDKPTENAIKNGNIQYFSSIHEERKIKRISCSKVGVIKQYFLIDYSLKHNQYILCKYFIMNPQWSHDNWLQTISSNAGLRIYQLACEQDDKELITWYRHKLICQNKKTKEQLYKILLACNLFNIDNKTNDILGIIKDYFDPTEQTLKKLQVSCSIL